MLKRHENADEASRKRFVPVSGNAAALLAAARAAGALVVYANADHRADRATSARTLRDTDNRLRPLGPGDPDGPLLTGGTEEARVVAELAPAPEDVVVPKHRWSAFHGTYLDLALRTKRGDTIILAGGSTDVGMASADRGHGQRRGGPHDHSRLPGDHNARRARAPSRIAPPRQGQGRRRHRVLDLQALAAARRALGGGRGPGADAGHLPPLPARVDANLADPQGTREGRRSPTALRRALR